MTFKVIITHPSVDDDENTYYGITMLQDGQTKSGRLEFSKSDNKLKVTLTYEFGGILLVKFFHLKIVCRPECADLTP